MKRILLLTSFITSISYSQTTNLLTLLNRNDSVQLQKNFEEGTSIETIIDEKKTLLTIACENGNLKMVKFLLNHGANIEHEASFDEKPLYFAAKSNHFDVVKYLVAKNASINPGFFKRSPVDAASSNGNYEMVKFLVEKGYKPNRAVLDAGGTDKYKIVKYLVEKGENPSDAIISASEDGNFEMVKYLVDKGANVYEKEKRRRGFLRGKYVVTPFERAVENNHKEIALYLMSKGLDKKECFKIAYSDKNNQVIARETLNKIDNVEAIIFLPVQKDDIIFLKLMLNKQPNKIDYTNDQGNTLLHEASLYKSSKCLAFLGTKKELLNSKNNQGLTPIMLAAKSGHAEEFNQLIALKADVSLKDTEGNSILHLACIGGNDNVINESLKYVSDINTVNEDGQTALILSILNAKPESINLLMVKNADVKAVDNYGNSCLHYASRKGNLALVKQLIDKGLDPKQENKLGVTPLEEATKNHQTAVIEHYAQMGMTDFETKDDQGYTSMMKAIKSCDFEQIKKLHDLGAKIENVGPDGYTLDCSKEEVVKYIIDNGGEINTPIKTFKETYLYKAVYYQNINLVKFLLEKGADPNITNTFKRPPLYQAVSSKNLAIVKLLVEGGANVNATLGYAGKENILSHAVEKENKEIITYLRENGAVLPGEEALGNISVKQSVKDDILKGIKFKNIKLVEDAIQNPSKFTLSEDESLEVINFIVKENHLNLLNYLLDNKAIATSYQDKLNGENLLIKVVKGKCEKKLSESLLRNGCDINEVDIRKKSALFYAVINEDLKMVTFLAELGANTNLEDMYGKKAIDYANKEIANYLKSIK